MLAGYTDDLPFYAFTHMHARIHSFPMCHSLWTAQFERIWKIVSSNRTQDLPTIIEYETAPPQYIHNNIFDDVSHSETIHTRPIRSIIYKMFRSFSYFLCMSSSCYTMYVCGEFRMGLVTANADKIRFGDVSMFVILAYLTLHSQCTALNGWCWLSFEINFGFHRKSIFFSVSSRASYRSMCIFNIIYDFTRFNFSISAL